MQSQVKSIAAMLNIDIFNCLANAAVLNKQIWTGGRNTH